VVGEKIFLEAGGGLNQNAKGKNRGGFWSKRGKAEEEPEKREPSN